MKTTELQVMLINNKISLLCRFFLVAFAIQASIFFSEAQNSYGNEFSNPGTRVYQFEEEHQKLITEVSTTEDSNAISVLVAGNCFLKYASSEAKKPLALNLYFPGTSLNKNKKKPWLDDQTERNIWVDSDIITSVNISELMENGPSRVEIMLKKETPYNITRLNNIIKVSFAKAPKPVRKNNVPKEEDTLPKKIISLSADENESTISIIIKGNRRLKYTSVRQFSLLSLFFPGTTIETEETELSLKSDIISAVKAFELSGDKKTTKVEILLKKNIRYKINQDSSTISISFKKPYKPPAPETRLPDPAPKSKKTG